MNDWNRLETQTREYVDGVLTGKIISGEAIKLACQRFKDWYTTDKYYYDHDKVERVINFISHITLFEDRSAGQPFILPPWQRWIVGNIFGWVYQDQHDKRVIRDVFLLVSRKSAKALDLNTEIPTPNGFKLLRDIHEGDIIFGADGKETKVLYESEIQYRPCYKMTFETGEEVIAADNHRWYVKDKNCRKSDNMMVKTTQELYGRGCYHQRKDGKGKEYYWRTIMNKPVEYSEKDLLVDPYILGQWIGDGCTASPNFVVHEGDMEMYDYAKSIYGEYDVYTDKRRTSTKTLIFRNTKVKGRISQLSTDLIKLGVFHNKHIPNEYKYGSIQQRLSLIQGLMDTDGCISKNHYNECEFTQKRKDIILDVKEILASLGIKSSIHEEYVNLNGKKCGPYYRLFFYTDKSMNVFRLKRKADVVPDNINKRSRYNTIKEIVPCDTVPCKCLAVDNEQHLFLFGRNYTVTHNTSLSAAILLAELVIDGVPGAEIYLLANSRDQAKIAFKFVSGFAQGLDPKHKHFKIYRDYIYYTKTKSTLKVLSSDSMTQDGYGASVALLDEYGAARDNSGYNIMKSSMGARYNPLIITISSANFLLDTYPCYESWKVGLEILRGIKEDDHTFYGIWQLDENDNWKDPNVWPKAIPNLGITVYRDFIEDRVNSAVNNSLMEADVLTKTFNCWVQSINGWLPSDIVNQSMQYVDANKFSEIDPCYIGVDLSEVSDLTAVSLLWPPDPTRSYFPDKYVFKSMIYIPKVALKESPNKSKYQNFIYKKEAKVTDGASVNYDVILADILSAQKYGCITKISYDQWMASIFTKNAIAEGMPMEPYSQSVGNFNRPTQAFEILIRNGKVVIDKNSCVLWCFNNVELRRDKQNNAKPQKSGDDRLKKIDPVISMLEALGGYLLDQDIYFGELTD